MDHDEADQLDDPGGDPGRALVVDVRCLDDEEVLDELPDLILELVGPHARTGRASDADHVGEMLDEVAGDVDDPSHRRREHTPEDGEDQIDHGATSRTGT
jgi:hypothetical protein